MAPLVILTLAPLDHEQAGGVRPDVDTGAAHGAGGAGARLERWTPPRSAMIRAWPTTAAAVEVRGLRKRYGEFEAVRGIDF